MEKTRNNLAKGTLLLTLSSFIVKVLSAIYRVPFQNMVGDRGYYVYQQAYPIYGIGMTLALSGLPLFISKLVSEQTTDIGKKDILSKSFVIVSYFSAVIFFIVFFGNSVIANGMDDSQLAPVIRMTSFIFLLVPVLSLYRGYFQGELWMTPTSVSQLIEQVIRVGVILIAAWLFTKEGWTYYFTGTVAMSGAVIGGIVAVICLFLYGKKVSVLKIQKDIKPTIDKSLAKRFLVEGGLICLFSAYIVLFQLVDAFFVKKMLVAGGYSEVQAQVLKGVYDRGESLVQMGLVIALALTSSYLPTLTKFFINNERKEYQQTVESFLKITLTLASAAAFGLVMIMPYINRGLFGDNKSQAALQLFMLSILLISMLQAYQAYYQSCIEIRAPFFSACAGLIVKLIITGYFTKIWGTVGTSFSTIVALLIALVIMSVDAHRKGIGFNLSFVAKLVVSLVTMILSVGLFNRLMTVINKSPGRGLSFLFALVGVVIGVVFFAIAIVQLKIFTIDEWLTLPFGKKIVKHLKRRKT